MAPEFSKTVKEVLARRAALLCSNPDCRTTTAGPSADPSKAVNIGEAAHIFGAMPGAARYRVDMTDGGRAEIANAIWLCRNCHRVVDSDASAYSFELLFQWRHDHERHILDKLGNRSGIARFDLFESKFATLLGQNSLAMQIAREKAPFWEHRLSAELLRQNLRRPARAWRDLNDDLYTRRVDVLSEEDVIPWAQARISEVTEFIKPLTSLYTRELQRSWGEPGVPGEVEEITHVCELIGRMGGELVRWEEDVRFTRAPEPYHNLPSCLSGAAGHQFEELMAVAGVLDAGIDRAEAASGGETVIEHTIVFNVPPGWENGISEETQRIRLQLGLPLEE